MDNYSICIPNSGIGDLHTTSSQDYESVNLQLTSVCEDREMYKPGCIKAEIKLTKDGGVTESDCTKIIDQILDKTVLVFGSFVGDKNTTEITRSYIVFSVQPRRMYNGGLQTILLLTMYSPDKFMDMRKYSKCYTAKCLGSNVLKDAIDIVSKKDGVTIDADYTHQQRLLFPGTQQANTLEVTDDRKTEYYIEGMLPYIVQYNETAHSFISRIANRCGEFFYYEKDKLILGLNMGGSQAINQTINEKDYTKKISILKSATVGNVLKVEEADIADVTYNEFTIREDYATKCPDYTTKYETAELGKRHIQAESNGNATPVQTYEGPSVEDIAGYSNTYKKTDAFDSYNGKGAPKTWLQLIFFLLQKDNLADMITNVGVNMGITELVQVTKGLISEKEYNKAYVEEYDKEENVLHKGQSKIYQFCVAADYNARLADGFYQSNKECSEVAKNGTVTVRLRETSKKWLRLGDFVNVFGCEYVVTKVHYELRKDTGAKYSNNWFEAVPALVVEDKDSNGNKCHKVRYVPAPLAGGTKRVAAPQRAIVKSSKDPLSLGRVRILYPWQPDDETQASPFIRVSQPYASASSGIRFTPQVGDEVMVGYEFDDIERPFMMGAIASTPTNGSKVDGNNDIIKSPNGHQIKFSNPSNCSAFVSGFSPVFKTLSNFGLSTIIDKDCKLNNTALAGSMQFTDTYGVYNVELSTDYRRIRIQSHLGNIEMSAMTGITINCPTGDVTIKGKNVNIEAGNTVSITSGKNIGTQRLYSQTKQKRTEGDSWWQSAGMNIGHSLLSGFVSNLVNDIRIKDALHLSVVDLTALRTVIEGFVKPINGTLLIKSNRFMQIEAGKGKTNIPKNIYRTANEKNKKDSLLTLNLQKEKEQNDLKGWYIKNSLAVVNNWYWTYNEIYNSAHPYLTTLLQYFVDEHIVLKEQAQDRVNIDDVKKKIDEILKANHDNEEQAKNAFNTYLGQLGTLAGNNERGFIETRDLQTKDNMNELFSSFVRLYLVYYNIDLADLNNRIPNDYVENIKKYHTDVITKYGITLTEAPDRTVMWREFMYDVIKLFNNKKKLLVGNTPKDISSWLLKDQKWDNAAKGKDTVCSDVEKWKTFVNSIQVYSVDTTWAGATEFLDCTKIVDAAVSSVIETNALWHPDKNGAILIADGNTDGSIELEKGNNNAPIFKYSTPPTENALSKLKKALISLTADSRDRFFKVDTDFNLGQEANNF